MKPFEGASGTDDRAVRFWVYFKAVVCTGLVAFAFGSCAKNTADVPRSTEPSVEATSATQSARSASAELIPVTSVEDGTCFDPQVDVSSMIRAVWTLPCSEPHAYEVYAVFDYEGDIAYRQPAYPGESAVQDQAEQRCYELFEPFVGLRWTVSELDIRTWWPSEASWADGDRAIICAVTSTDRTALRGSQEQSRR